MIVYQERTSHSTDHFDSLKYRHEILMRSFMLTYPNLKQLDEQRNFTNEQRIAIYRKNKGICQECGEKCGWENWHADPIIPWSQSGHTTVENGPVLCPTCNLRKGGEE
jgi:5-methylcytosine-specific restriction endonuclease McrA